MSPNLGSPLSPPKPRSTVSSTDLLKKATSTSTVSVARPYALPSLGVGEAEVELDRDGDQCRARRAIRRRAGSRTAWRASSLLGSLPLELEVDAGHHVHASAGDADVQRGGRPELERCLELLDPGGVHLQVEEASAAEDRDREQEWVIAL